MSERVREQRERKINVIKRKLRGRGRFQKHLLYLYAVMNSVTRKKSPNVYKSCPKMISLEK